MNDLREESRKKYLENRSKKITKKEEEDIEYRKFLATKGFLSEKEIKEIEIDEKIIKIAKEIGKNETSSYYNITNSEIKGETIDEQLKNISKIYSLQEKYNSSLKKENNWQENILNSAIGLNELKLFSTPIIKIEKNIKKIDYSKIQQSLPIFKFKDIIIESVNKYSVLIIVGDTGSGKSTQIPQYLLERSLNENIICTQPRRVAAMSVSSRVAQERNCELGFEVGYSVRFEDKTSNFTKIRYMTDGTLLREFLLDPLLSKYTTLMIDEAHERSISTDILLSLLKDLIIIRPEFRLIISSATIDAEKFSKFYNNSPILYIPGRRFTVEIFYSDHPIIDYEDGAIKTILDIHSKTNLIQPCDILVFLTGQEEIENSIKKLKLIVKDLNLSPLDILPIYSALPNEKQIKIFIPSLKGTRKVIFSTNIAETSITLDTIKYVIDSGYVKESNFNSKNGCSSLDIVPISQSSAEQRAGRAGRICDGFCYRLYTQNQYLNEMNKMSKPELLRCDFTSTLLLLLSMGIQTIIDFDFLDSPPSNNIMSSYEQLYLLNAIINNSQITELGHQMAQLPVLPQTAKTIIESFKLGCSNSIIKICSILESGSPLFLSFNKEDKTFETSQKHFWDNEGDHITILNVYNTWVETDYSSEWCNSNGIQWRTLNISLNIQKQINDICNYLNLFENNNNETIQNISKAFSFGFFQNVSELNNLGQYQTLKGLTEVDIHPSSCLKGPNPPKYCIFYELYQTTKKFMRIIIKTEPKWLKDAAPNLFDFINGEEPKIIFRNK